MYVGEMKTKFAPPERASNEIVQKSVKLFEQDTLTAKFLNATTTPVVVINKYRQIVYLNQLALELLKKNPEAVYGIRLGEAFNCAHSDTEEGGCGTSEYCQMCGAVNVMVKGIKGVQSVQECRILTKDGDAVEFLVKGTPLDAGGDNYVVFALHDISGENRRRALERIFFHDILNTAGGLKGFIEILAEADKEESEEFLSIVKNLSNRLIDEIEAQKQLNLAENDELAISVSKFDLVEFLDEMVNLYKNHTVSIGKWIERDKYAKTMMIKSDRRLLGRVIGNMVKNALEACKDEDTVTLGSLYDGEQIEIWVHNPGFIPRNVQLQIFNRAYSTKGAGRGLGTFSMKLLSERYLQGKVEFSSTEEGGTIFKGIYPVALQSEVD